MNTQGNGAVIAALAMQRHELATSAAINFAKLDALSDESSAQIVEALKGADFAVFEQIASVWQGAYTEEKGCNEEGGRMAWSRMCKAFDIEKPKSQSPEALAKAGERAKARAELAAVPAAKLAEQRDSAIAEAKVALEKGDTKASREATNVATKAMAELARRHKDEQKPQAEALAKKRTHVIDRIRKEATLEMLARIEELLDKVHSATTEHVTPAAKRRAA